MIKSVISFGVGLILILLVAYYFAPNATKATVKSAVGWVSTSGGKGDDILAQ